MNEIINYSSQETKDVKILLPPELSYTKAIIFPDICKVNWPLPTGVAILTSQRDWRKYAISDLGCGMLFCESNLSRDDFDEKKWDELCCYLRNKSKINNFRKGNHFINALVSNKKQSIYFVIHCGFDKDIASLEKNINNHKIFDDICCGIITKAKDRRYLIFDLIQNLFGKLKLILDKDHNHFQDTPNGIVIRRGSTHVPPGDLSIIPSHIGGKTALVVAKSAISNTFESLCHGTGKTTTSEQKNILNSLNNNRSEEIDSEVYIPESINRIKLIKDTPCHYRSLEECLPRINSLVEVIDTFYNIAYLGKI